MDISAHNLCKRRMLIIKDFFEKEKDKRCKIPGSEGRTGMLVSKWEGPFLVLLIFYPDIGFSQCLASMCCVNEHIEESAKGFFFKFCAFSGDDTLKLDSFKVRTIKKYLIEYTIPYVQWQIWKNIKMAPIYPPYEELTREQRNQLVENSYSKMPC